MKRQRATHPADVGRFMELKQSPYAERRFELHSSELLELHSSELLELHSSDSTSSGTSSCIRAEKMRGKSIS